MRFAGVRRVSATRDRSSGVERRRRGRWSMSARIAGTSGLKQGLFVYNFILKIGLGPWARG